MVALMWLVPDRRIEAFGSWRPNPSPGTGQCENLQKRRCRLKGYAHNGCVRSRTGGHATATAALSTGGLRWRADASYWTPVLWITTAVSV
jgi:hypothetical protein